MTCKWWRVRERWSGGEGEVAECEQRRCVWCILVTAQQLHHMSALEKEKGKPFLLFKTALHCLPDAVAIALWCSGNWRTHTFTDQIGEGCNYLPSLFFLFLCSDCLPHSLVVSRLVKIALHRYPPILLWDADNDQAYEISTMAATLGMSVDNRRLKRGRG